MKKNLSSVILILILLLTTLSCACSAPNKSVSKSGFYFDTIIKITLYDTDDEAYIDQCFNIASDYESKFSNTIEGSDIYRINENAGKEAVEVSNETIELLKLGIYYGKLSDGNFDITLGRLSSLWNFSEISKNLAEGNIADKGVLPAEDDIKDIISHIDYNNIEIDGNKVYLTDSKAQIDLGGIAKGYIADKMKEFLNDKSIVTGIIDLGGNILTIGPKKDSSYYKIGIQYPFSDTGQTIAIVSVDDKSVVTSGVYERYYYVDDKLYHHILNPKSGYPYSNKLHSVTIISDNSVDGDALSTSCYALGLDKGLELIESLDNIEAVFIDDSNEIYYSSGLEGKITIK